MASKPTLLNDLIADDIERALRVGLSIKDSAKAAGVTERRVHEWLSRGRRYEADLEGGVDPNERDEPFYEFLCRVEKARGMTRLSVAGVVMRGILGEIRRDAEGNVVEVLREPDPHLALKWLERQNPAEWGRSTKPVEAIAEEEEERLDDVVAEGERLIARAAEQIAREAGRTPGG